MSIWPPATGPAGPSQAWSPRGYPIPRPTRGRYISNRTVHTHPAHILAKPGISPAPSLLPRKPGSNAASGNHDTRRVSPTAPSASGTVSLPATAGTPGSHTAALKPAGLGHAGHVPKRGLAALRSPTLSLFACRRRHNVFRRRGQRGGWTSLEWLIWAPCATLAPDSSRAPSRRVPDTNDNGELTIAATVGGTARPVRRPRSRKAIHSRATAAYPVSSSCVRCGGAPQVRHHSGKRAASGGLGARAGLAGEPAGHRPIRGQSPGRLQACAVARPQPSLASAVPGRLRPPFTGTTQVTSRNGPGPGEACRQPR